MTFRRPRPSDVSVVIPTRFRPDMVVRAVRSALSQSEGPREVIVVIDGPDQATSMSLRGIDDGRLVVHEAPSNGGPGRARNAGVAMCSGEWIAFLDDDDEWMSTKL